MAVAWRRARRRHGWLDHLVRAWVRYDQADGGRLAAAVTYYAFFATFALALLGFAVFGFLLDDPVVLRSVQRYLAQNLPSLDTQALRHARGTVGVIAFVGLPVTGWFWVDALRSSIRKVWGVQSWLTVARSVGVYDACACACRYCLPITHRQNARQDGQGRAERADW
jgi:membrane protein